MSGIRLSIQVELKGHVDPNPLCKIAVINVEIVTGFLVHNILKRFKTKHVTCLDGWVSS